MRTLVWSKNFVRAFRKTVKKNPRHRGAIEEALHTLADDAFAANLATHKLKGRLAGAWACSVAYDLRIIFEFVRDEETDSDAIFLMAIGTHDEVY